MGNYVEKINHPLHYNEGPTITITYKGETLTIPLECIEVVRNMPFWKGNVIKYVWRAGLKAAPTEDPLVQELEDLEKAAWYLQDRIKQIKMCLENYGKKQSS